MRRHGVAHRDPLVEGGEDAESHPPPQGGLADEQAGERASGVQVVVGQHPHGFELVVDEQVGLVDAPGPGSGRARRVRRRARPVAWGISRVAWWVGVAAERGDDGVVDAADADRGLGR